MVCQYGAGESVLLHLYGSYAINKILNLLEPPFKELGYMKGFTYNI